MQSNEAERLAARLRALKARAGISFEEVARRTGISSSSVHRYCSGSKIAPGYGVVHALGQACGASSAELRELHRLWALADAARLPDTSGTTPAAVADEEPLTAASAESSDATAPVASSDSTPPAAPPSDPGGRPPRWHRHRFTILTATGLAATGALVLAVLSGDRPGASGQAGGPSQDSGSTAVVRVFNVEDRCRTRSDRAPGCSIGLAVDPRRNYDARNVVAQRVWHGEELKADCVLHEGDEVVDEIGTKSTRWYRVRLDSVGSGHAWLPGIRTRDTPALSACTL
ncbi:helix-turn-helix domain-containing protein [Streptomyces sp. NPDC050418]|uniref:helix-turn-helix domain-containing protein n=1 Tax=Streptomyces sp. NPDC050418 TaxID=3365612 RepID=UPI0037BDA482